MLELSRAESAGVYRQERERRWKLAMHMYNDVQLREVMDDSWRRQDESGIIRGYPEFVAKYISDPFLTIEGKAVILWDRVETKLIRRLNTQLE